MMLKIKTKLENDFTVKAHRILIKTFPKLELYVHRPILVDKAYKKSYVISTKSGISITNLGYFNLCDAITRTVYYIEKYGEDNIIEMMKEMLECIKTKETEAHK